MRGLRWLGAASRTLRGNVSHPGRVRLAAPLAVTILAGTALWLTACLPERAAWTGDSRTLYALPGEGVVVRWDAATSRTQCLALQTGAKGERLLAEGDAIQSVRMDPVHDRLLLLLLRDRAQTGGKTASIWQIPAVSKLDPKPTTCTVTCSILAGAQGSRASDPKEIDTTWDITPDGTVWWLGKGGDRATSASQPAAIGLWQDNAGPAKRFLDLTAGLTSGTELGGMAIRVDPAGTRVAIPAQEQGGKDQKAVLLVRNLAARTWSRFDIEATPALWLDSSRLVVLQKQEGDNDESSLCLLNVDDRTTRTLCERVPLGLNAFAEPGKGTILATVVVVDEPVGVGDVPDQGTKRTEVDRLNLATGARDVVIGERGLQVAGLGLSPDGRLLAYSAESDAPATKPSLRVRNLQTGEDRLIWADYSK